MYVTGLYFEYIGVPYFNTYFIPYTRKTFITKMHTKLITSEQIHIKKITISDVYNMCVTGLQ